MLRSRPINRLEPALLEHLTAHDLRTAVEIAEALGVPRPSVSRALARMREDQHVVSCAIPGRGGELFWRLKCNESEPLPESFEPALRVHQNWKRSNEWTCDHRVPRNSVFDTAAFLFPETPKCNK